MSLPHYILGWLAASPTHGYELKKRYREFINPDEKLGDAKLYPLLKELERQGLVEKRLEDTGTGPARKVVHVTEAGRAEFLRWLTSSEGEDYEGRPPFDFFRAFPFLTKYPFFRPLGRKALAGKLQAQLALHRQRLEGYLSTRERMREKGLSEPKLQALEFGILLEEAKLTWLERALASATQPPSAGGAKRSRKGKAVPR
ncbi:MAG: PadR family transcriptional regulator [Deltaproteobacteria bacterium]|nr:PadR family transcriptional regulator [Deltaproteobacteria bacterium]